LLVFCNKLDLAYIDRMVASSRRVRYRHTEPMQPLPCRQVVLRSQKVEKRKNGNGGRASIFLGMGVSAWVESEQRSRESYSNPTRTDKQAQQDDKRVGFHNPLIVVARQSFTRSIEPAASVFR